jgi:phage-related protein
MEIHFFDKSLEKFILSLEKPTIAKVLRTLDLLEEFGNVLGAPHTKKISKDLFELRIRGTQEIRIFFAFRKGGAVLLHGFIKKSMKAPPREIDHAKTRLKRLDAI